jgi:serine/threonine protein kinase
MAVICVSCRQENNDNSKYCSSCGSNLDKKVHSKNTLDTGILLDNRYEIEGLIKFGGMGAVYKAFDKRLRRVCAVKEMLSFNTEPKEQEYAVKRFEEEAFILSSLKHDNLPVVYDYFIDYGKYYLIMDLIEGEDMETVIKRDGNPGLPEDTVLEVAKDILNVLIYLHSKTPPVVYRDIKPSNIMVRSDGRVMLIDFGIARTVQAEDADNRTVIGTIGYAPLEQYQGRVEPGSDLYALGATMHHLLSGKQPVPLDIPPLRSIAPHVSNHVEEIIMKAVKENIEERFSCAKDMLQACSRVETVQGHSLSKPEVNNVSYVTAKQIFKYVFSNRWGTSGTGQGQFYSPKGITADREGYIYILDTGSKSIQKFDCNGKFLKRFNLEDYASVDLELSPGIAVDTEGCIYICDTGNECIKKFDQSGDFIIKWGSFGTGDGQFSRPCGIAIDGLEHIYVADTRNHRIQIFDRHGNFLMKFGSYGSEDKECYYPKGIAVDEKGNIYITHAKKHRIQKFDSHGNFIMKFGGKGSSDGQFEDPMGISVDLSGNIYVADTLNNRIQKFNSKGNFIIKLGSYGAGEGKFKNPSGITSDLEGNIYVADTGNKRIQKFVPQG